MQANIPRVTRYDDKYHRVLSAAGTDFSFMITGRDLSDLGEDESKGENARFGISREGK